MAETNQIPDYQANFSLGSLAGIPEGRKKDPETGIPYQTDMYSLPLGTSGKFYGTGIDPSQRFIFQRLKLDTQGDPIKMFEKWETFDESDREWIADMDQRRDELQPDEIDTLDALKMVVGDAIKPYITDAAKKYAYASAAESGGETTLAGLGLDPFGLDASQVAKAKTAMEFGDSPRSYALKEASPFHKTNFEQHQALANKAPTGYEYSPELNQGAVQFDPNTMLQTKDGTIYHKSGTSPTSYTASAPQGTLQRPTGRPSLYDSSSASTFRPSYQGGGVSTAMTSGVSGGVPSTGSFGYGQTISGPTVPVGNIVSDAMGAEPSFWSGESFSNRMDTGFSPTAMATQFGVSFGVNLITGSGKPIERIEEAADSAAGATIFGAIGTAIGGPVGGFIGSTIGSIIGSGGRVICNELMRQKLLSKQDVILDYRFTRDYLTPTHVKGYHVWAIHVVQQMRKGRFVKFWKHIAKHRANEIAYIYGKKDKPDYLGKIYRKIGEPTCWVIGVFCEQSDWSILYKEKKIGN